MASMVLLLAACQGGGEPQGEVRVAVRGLSATEIQRMVVTAQPANVSQTLTYDANSGHFSGSLTLPVGDQALAAEGYGGEAGTTLVASGSANVTVVANTTTAVTLRIYDRTPAPPPNNTAPIIRSVTVSKTEPLVGESITLTVDAVDLEGDPLSLSWQTDCASSTFSNPAGSTTTWSSTVAGTCEIAVVALSVRPEHATTADSETVLVTVLAPASEGTVQVDGEYIARPTIRGMSIFGPGIDYTTRLRASTVESFPDAQSTGTYTITVDVDFSSRYGAYGFNLLSPNCGSIERVNPTCPGDGTCSIVYTWTAVYASTPLACKLTATASNDGLSDSFSVGMRLR